VLSTSLDTSDIDLLPFDRNIVRLENFLDRLGDLGTDTVTYSNASGNHDKDELMLWIDHTWNEGHRVLAAKLGRSEDVASNSGGHG